MEQQIGWKGAWQQIGRGWVSELEGGGAVNWKGAEKRGGCMRAQATVTNQEELLDILAA